MKTATYLGVVRNPANQNKVSLYRLSEPVRGLDGIEYGIVAESMAYVAGQHETILVGSDEQGTLHFESHLGFEVEDEEGDPAVYGMLAALGYTVVDLAKAG